MFRSGVILFGLLLLALVCIDVASARVNVKRHPRSLEAQQATGGNLANIHFNGVVNSSLGHYFIYYGNQFTSGDDAAIPAAVQQYCTDFSDSDYLNILPQYYGRSTSDLATRQIHFVGQSIVGAPYGTTISDTSERCGLKILERLLKDTTMNIPFDPTVQYYMIYGSDITIADTFPSCGDNGACGLHSQKTITLNGVTSKYLCAWVATIPGCIGKQVSQLTGPNADENTQSVLDTLSHEVAETITDPNQLPDTDRAWEDSERSEIGDKCTTYYGTVQPSTKKAGAYYNVLANGNEYMVQGQWSNAISGCTLGIPVTDRTPSTSPAAGVTPSNTGAAPASASVAATPTVTPSNFGGLPSSACITCNKPVCRRTAKFQKVCKNKLGGTYSNATAGTLCCNSITTFSSFSWTVYSSTCEYPAPEHKLAQLCLAIGGRTSCAVGDLGATRITCNR